MIEQLEPDEMPYITREDFKWKTRTPSFFFNQLTKTSGKKFKVMRSQNKNRWVVERVGVTLRQIQ
ncbi:MAG: hypothetical protein ABI723_08605 [Bacteroidia bacterium]